MFKNMNEFILLLIVIIILFTPLIILMADQCYERK